MTISYMLKPCIWMIQNDHRMHTRQVWPFVVSLLPRCVSRKEKKCQTVWLNHRQCTSWRRIGDSSRVTHEDPGQHDLILTGCTSEWLTWDGDDTPRTNFMLLNSDFPHTCEWRVQSSYLPGLSAWTRCCYEWGRMRVSSMISDNITLRICRYNKLLSLYGQCFGNWSPNTTFILMLIQLDFILCTYYI